MKVLDILRTFANSKLVMTLKSVIGYENWKVWLRKDADNLIVEIVVAERNILIFHIRLTHTYMYIVVTTKEFSEDKVLNIANVEP